MDNVNFNKNLSKTEKQISLIETSLESTRQQLSKFYQDYLKIVRDELRHIIKESINSLSSISYEKNNINEEYILSFIKKDLDSLVNQILPFLTIEQLSIPNVEDKYELKNINIPLANKFCIDNKANYNLKDKNKDIYKIEKCSPLYSDYLYEDNLSSSIDLDKNNYFKDSSQATYDEENKMFFSLIDLSQDYEKNLLTPTSNENKEDTKSNYKGSSLLQWSDIIDTSLSFYMRRFTISLNKSLFQTKVFKKPIPDNVLNLLLDNQYLLSNPLPFLLKFDLNSNVFFNDNISFSNESNFSLIYLFSLNKSELEFYDLRLNVLRNKIYDLKKHLRSLIPKEKYWKLKKN